MTEKGAKQSQKDSKTTKQQPTMTFMKAPYNPTKWCPYHKCPGHGPNNFFALLRMQRQLSNPDKQTSNPNAEQEIYQDPFPDHSEDKKGKAKAKNKKKKSKSKRESSSSSEEEEEKCAPKPNQKITHYRQCTDGSKVPPDNSAEASTSKYLEVEGTKKGAKFISLVETDSQYPKEFLVLTRAQARKESTSTSQPSNPSPIEETQIPLSESIIDKSIPNRPVRFDF